MCRIKHATRTQQGCQCPAELTVAHEAINMIKAWCSERGGAQTLQSQSSAATLSHEYTKHKSSDLLFLIKLGIPACPLHFPHLQTLSPCFREHYSLGLNVSAIFYIPWQQIPHFYLPYINYIPSNMLITNIKLILWTNMPTEEVKIVNCSKTAHPPALPPLQSWWDGVLLLETPVVSAWQFLLKLLFSVQEIRYIIFAKQRT